MRNVLCLTGDHPIHGDQPQARPVFDLDSIQLVALVALMSRQGRYMSGREIKPAPDKDCLWDVRMYLADDTTPPAKKR